MKALLKILSSARSFVRDLFRKQQVEMNLDDEVRAYVHLLTDEKMAGGMNAGGPGAQRLWRRKASSK